jgi:hypothetical protein
MIQAAVTRSGDKTLLTFSKQFDETFTGKGPQNFIAARGPAGRLAYHTYRTSFSASIDGAGVTVANANRDLALQSGSARLTAFLLSLCTAYLV